MNGTIRQRLTIAFFALVLLPPVLVGLGLVVQNEQIQREQAIFLQQQIGLRVATQINSFISGLERDLTGLVFAHRLRELPLAEQRSAFQELMIFQDAFEELTLVDATGNELLRISQLGFVMDDDLKSRLNDEAYLAPTASLQNYFSPVWFNSSTGEPFITIAIPVINVRDNAVEGVLIADTRLKRVWELLGTMPMGEGESVFIVDEQNRVVAHRNPSVVLRQTTYAVPAWNGQHVGLDNTAVFSAVEAVQFGDQTFYIVAERSVAVALGPTRNMIGVTAVSIFFLLIMATILGMVISRQIVQPVQELAATAHDIRSGDLSVRVTLPPHKDEIYELARAFNSMADQLQETMTGLEENIEKLQNAEERLTVYAANLKRSNDELQSFAYVASHDLQEPLRKIQTFSDRMVNRYHSSLDERGIDYLIRMQSAAARMQGLIQDLLVFSRVTTHKQPYHEVDLELVVQDVLADLELLIEETQADIQIGDLPVIEADETQMRQLFQNLIGNALKFVNGQTKPIIQIRSQSVEKDREPYWQLSVSDNGIGFEEKYTDRIFTIFQRLHGRQAYKGTGVGLAICRKIVERHGGCIFAKSRPGEGATFFVVLPQKRETLI